MVEKVFPSLLQELIPSSTTLPAAIGRAAADIQADRSFAALLRLARSFPIMKSDSEHPAAEAIGAQACLHRALYAHPFGPMTSYYACWAYTLADRAIQSTPAASSIHRVRLEAAVAALAAVRHAPHVRRRFRERMEPIRLEWAEEAYRRTGSSAGEDTVRQAVESRVHTCMHFLLTRDAPVREESPARDHDPGEVPDTLLSPEFCLWLSHMELRKHLTSSPPNRQGLIDAYQFMFHGIPEEAVCMFHGLYADETEQAHRFCPAARGAILASVMLHLQHPQTKLHAAQVRRMDTLTELVVDFDEPPIPLLLHLLWCWATAVRMPAKALQSIQIGCRMLEKMSDHPLRPAWLKPDHLQDAKAKLTRTP